VLAALPREAGATVAGVMRDIARPARRPSVRAWWAGGAALAAAAAIVLVLARGQAPPPRGGRASAPAPAGAAAPATAAVARRGPEAARAVVESLEGDVWRRLDGEPVRVRHGDGLAPGESVRTSAGHGAAVVRFPDGTRAALGGASELALAPPAAPDRALARGFELALAAGRLVVEAGPALRRISTPLAAIVPASGARVHVAAAAPRTRVEVRAGSARVEPLRPANPVEVRAGQSALVAEEPGSGAPAVRVGRAPPLALLVTGTVNKDRRLDADERVRERLGRLGFDVVHRADAAATAAEAREAAVVFISSSVDIEHIGPRFRAVEVPIVTAEPWLLDDMGMTAAGRADNQSFWNEDLVVVAPEHPMAAGLSGRVKVAAGRILTGWGRPNGVAVTVAAAADGALERATIFAYEKGAAMPGLEAPARRVHFFMHDAAALSLTDAGWSLFDAAIRWAAGP
jgi:hypothetical protein